MRQREDSSKGRAVCPHSVMVVGVWCVVQCKVLDGESSQYEPSKRSDAWLKIKRDYVDDLHDTLDLVPIGAW